MMILRRRYLQIVTDMIMMIMILMEMMTMTTDDNKHNDHDPDNHRHHQSLGGVNYGLPNVTSIVTIP